MWESTTKKVELRIESLFCLCGASRNIRCRGEASQRSRGAAACDHARSPCGHVLIGTSPAVLDVQAREQAMTWGKDCTKHVGAI